MLTTFTLQSMLWDKQTKGSIDLKAWLGLFFLCHDQYSMRISNKPNQGLLYSLNFSGGAQLWLLKGQKKVCILHLHLRVRQHIAKQIKQKKNAAQSWKFYSLTHVIDWSGILLLSERNSDLLALQKNNHKTSQFSTLVLLSKSLMFDFSAIYYFFHK